MSKPINFTGITFDGSTYVHPKDGTRLATQLGRVFRVMKDGVRRTLSEISILTNDPQSSISARLRDFRKPKFGNHTVSRYRNADGLYFYSLLVNNKAPKELGGSA